jgi:uncharacterized protein
VNADPAAQRRLLDLQAVDTTLAQLAHRRRSLPELAEIARRDEQLSGLAEDLVRLETEVADISREERRLETDVDQVRQRAARDQQRLDTGRVGSPRELESLQHEVGSLARRQSDLEDQVLELMERRETADAALATAQSGLATAQAEQERAEQLREAALADIADATKQHQGKRDEIAGTVPADLLKLYDRIAAQTGSTGAAHLHARRCEGCRIEFYGNELSAYRNADPHTVLRCENCGRILVRTADSGL